jgi:hypothetical protein
MKLIHTCIALIIASGAAPVAASAQQPSPPAAQHERAKDPEPITGEIVSVNTGDKTLTVKNGADSVIKFSFSEETEIVGADKGAEGLATKAGTNVTVTYTVHGTANVAVKIEVLPKT